MPRKRQIVGYLIEVIGQIGVHTAFGAIDDTGGIAGVVDMLDLQIGISGIDELAERGS